MTRFFVPACQFEGNRVILEGSDRHHLLNVLRGKIGAEITVLNGKGEEYLARITAIDPERAVAEIITAITGPVEPKLRLTLAQSLPKADKFEFIIQKNTEIGVARFQPIISERGNIRLDQATGLKKRERWRKIIQEAAEQSGRRIIPEIEPIRDWETALANLHPGLVLLPWEGERERSLKEVLEAEKSIPEEITLLIGPEGGFSIKEVELARTKGAVPVTLGPRILRTETAGLAATAAIFYHYGDLG